MCPPPGDRVRAGVDHRFDCELCLGGAVDRLVVRGAVDDRTAGLFRDELDEACRTADGALVVDLSEVTALSPSGARVLTHALLRGADSGAPVHLCPGAEGPARATGSPPYDAP